MSIQTSSLRTSARNRWTPCPLIVVHRPSNHAWMATLPFEELLPLLALRERG